MSIREHAFAGKPLSCRIIDAHTHIGSYHLNGWHQKYDEITTGQIQACLRNIGIDCIVTAPHPMVQGWMECANEIALQQAMAFPGFVYGYISIVPSCGMDAVKNAIERYAKEPAFLGLKFLTGYHGEILQPEYEYAMDFADEVSCPVLCHAWGDIPKRSGFEAALKTRHKMSLIIAHQGGGSAADTRACAPMIRSYENAYMELCGSLYNQYSVEAIAQMVGIDKVIFGTDCINLDPKYELGRVVFSQMADKDKEKIFAKNYLRLTDRSQMGKIQL